MEIITLIDSDGKEKKTTKTAWNHAPEQKRLKVQGWKLKPETPVQPQAEVAAESTPAESETKPKKSQKNG